MILKRNKSNINALEMFKNKKIADNPVNLKLLFIFNSYHKT